MDKKSVPLTFALLGNGVIRHVDDVDNGLACDCFCPTCGSSLVAKHGSQTIHHFAHEGSSDCIGGVETALHLAAKEILTKERQMMLPPLTAYAKAKDSSGKLHQVKRSIASKIVLFENVSTEVRLNGVIPDIVACVGSKTLLIEVVVSHFADETKVALLRERDLATVEVDLSGMAKGWTWALLAEAILTNPENKKWLYNPKSQMLYTQANEEAKMLAAKADIKNATWTAKVQAGIPGFSEARELLQVFVSPQNFSKEFERMNAEGPSIGAWQSASRVLGIRWDAHPNFLNIEIAGEMGFLVDRRVWQAALFALFIQSNRNRSFTSKSAARWCVQNFGWRKEFLILQKYDYLLIPEEQRVLPSASRAVYAYLRVLVELGFIVRKGERYEILKRLIR